MERAAFESFADDMLKDLGRVAVNFGFAEFLLDIHVGLLFNVNELHARMGLIAPLPTRRKIDLLQAGIERIPGLETRALVAEACKLITECLTARNEMLHGIWGYDAGDPGAAIVCITTKKNTGHRTRAEIPALADKIAIATRKLADAVSIDAGHVPSGVSEQRLVIKLG